jgi:hypothetical protein
MERIVDGSNLDNLTWILVHFLQFNGGIPTNNIVNKLVSLAQMEFDCFERNLKWNSIQLCKYYTPFIVEMHDMTQQCNLVVQIANYFKILKPQVILVWVFFLKLKETPWVY